MSGTTNITTSTQVSPIGIPARLFNMHIFAGATSTVKIFNGGTNGIQFFQYQINSNRAQDANYGYHGQLFPNGIYVTTDSGTLFVTLSHERE